METLVGFAKDSFEGASFYYRAVLFIREHRMYPYLLLPAAVTGTVSLIVMLMGFFVAFYLGGYVLHMCHDFLSYYFPSAGTSIFFGAAFSVLHVVLFVVLMTMWLLILIILLRPLTMVLCRPFLIILAGKVEAKMGFAPVRKRQHNENMVMEIMRGCAALTSTLLCEGLLWAVLALSTVLLPVVGTLIFLAVGWGFESFWAGCNLIDIPFQLHGLSVQNGIDFNRSHRGLLSGLGIGYIMIMCIPFVGWFVAPTLGTVAATLLAMKRYDREDRKAG